MARSRVVLQPPKELSGSETQKNEDAARVGNNRQGVVFIDVYANTGTLTITIETCSNVDTSAGGGNSWVSLGAKTFTSTGSDKLAITDLGDAIRWDGSISSGSATFAIRAFLSDE